MVATSEEVKMGKGKTVPSKGKPKKDEEKDSKGAKKGKPKGKGKK
jgi:hypothetical protein